jgi:hypothetical protein
MEIDVISEQEVRQIALNTVCEYIKEDEWCEDGSVRMDIKNLQDQYHQTTVSQINRLWDETRQLQDAIVQIQKIVRDLVKEVQEKL